MGVREEILCRLREVNNEKKKFGERQRAVEERLKTRPQGIIPDQGERDLMETFIAKAESAAASVASVPLGKLGEAIGEFLRQHDLPHELIMGDDDYLAGISWGDSAPTIKKGPCDGTELAGLSMAVAAAGETGTLFLTSGPDNPTSNNFLPENHIVIVKKSDIAWSYEEVWEKLSQGWLKTGTDKVKSVPRTINMITGPSRSADIEQTLILGAHGPVRLHVLIVED